MSQIKTKYIADNQVTNAKLAQVSTQTIKGRTTAGTGNPEDLTATQATAILNVVVGDSGSGGTKGLVPAPGAGDAALGKFLKADGTFAIPGSSDIISALQFNVGVDALPITEGSLGTIDTQTQLLLHLDNNIYDASSYARTLTQSTGSATYVTGKFNQGLNVTTGAFPQLTSYPAAFALSTGDFTIELWAKSSGLSHEGYLASAGLSGVGQDWALHVSTSGVITWDNPTVVSASSAFPFDGNWHHVAFVRNGNVHTIYVDGVSVATVTQSFTYSYAGTNGISFGGVVGDTSNNNTWAGSIDEARVSVGIARWTTGFTPPIIPYTTSQYATINFGSHQLQSSAVPADNTSLTNKLYVDTAVATRTLASSGDINETSFTAADNQSSAANVTGLAFANGTVRSFRVHLSIVRASTYANYELVGIQRGSDWAMDQSYVGDVTGLVFTITTAGQIKYTSTSTGSTALLKFRAQVTTV